MMHPYTTSIIAGLLKAIMLSALTNSFFRLPAASLNLLFSWSSRTNALTTRIADTFSCTLALSASYLVNTTLNVVMAFIMIIIKANASTAIATRKIVLRSGLITKHIITEIVSISGGRTAIRMIIWNAFCTFVTSVVIRVTRPAVENLSILEKENSCICRYISARRFFAKPVAAAAAWRPAWKPKNRLQKAIMTISPPYFNTAFILPALIPWSMIIAVT